MVIQIRLSDRIDHSPDQIETDSLHRTWCGYDPTAGDEVLWEHNRGRWDLSETRINDESYATFVYGGVVVAAYEVDGHERVSDPGRKGTKIALIGRPLASNNPVYRRLVGRPAIHRGRNAVNYVSDHPVDYGADDSVNYGPDGPVEEELLDAARRRAFLLTWNPDNWDWADFGQCVLATEGAGTVARNRSTGVRTSGIHPGDLLFLLRQGKRGRGIVGSGRATDFTGNAGPHDEIIYTAPHWDGSGAVANYVDVLWDQLVETADLLPIEDLKADFPEQNWTPMSSGTQIRPDVVDALEKRWSKHVGASRTAGYGQGFLVNAKRRKAIEDAAQDWLMQHYRDEDWEVKDTRYSGPYDAVATKDGQTIYLEAKGTQSSGDAVFLTRGEIEHARRNDGDCVIGIWSGMRFTEKGEIDDDKGETLIMPFEPDTGTLTALQYRWEFGVDN